MVESAATIPSTGMARNPAPGSFIVMHSSMILTVVLHAAKLGASR
jgi:hypothetical protein